MANAIMSVTGDSKDVSTSKLLVKRLIADAVMPVRSSVKAAGLDIFSAYPYVVKAGGRELIKTGLSIKVPPNTYGRLAPRSGLAWKNGIDVGAGVIDEDYRGEVGVILFNHDKKDFVVNKGDRIAQLIIEKIVYCEVSEVTELDDTQRGDNGFGSTGVNQVTIPYKNIIGSIITDGIGKDVTKQFISSNIFPSEATGVSGPIGDNKIITAGRPSGLIAK